MVDPISQWPVLDYENYPPKPDEAYLYYKGAKAKQYGLKIQVAAFPEMLSNETLINARVSFDYWGRGGVGVDQTTDDYAGSTFFRIGVSFKAEDKPETEWATFTGNSGTLNGNKWMSFDKTEKDAFYPARIMINPVLENTDSVGEYYVALKSIKVTYMFKQSKSFSSL